MRALTIALAATIAVTAGFTAVSVVTSSGAEAKAHVTPGKPGKCGVLKFYSKKDKGCVSKG